MLHVTDLGAKVAVKEAYRRATLADWMSRTLVALSCLCLTERARELAKGGHFSGTAGSARECRAAEAPAVRTCRA